jgi:uncharacterized protein (TIGR03435 family)
MRKFRIASLTIVVCLSCASLFGQASANLNFEVASVKPASRDQQAAGPARGGPGTSDPTQITISGSPLLDLLMRAHNLKPYQIAGPGWLAEARFDIVAKIPPNITAEELRTMLRNLLIERFALRTHQESREVRVKELTVSDRDTRLKETNLDPAAPPAQGPPRRDANGLPELSGAGTAVIMSRDRSGQPVAQLVGRAQTIAQLAVALTDELNQPVVDKTGLTGRYDYVVEYSPDLTAMTIPPAPRGAPGEFPASADPGTNLLSAVGQQLGLKVVSGRGKIEVLVVDHAERTPADK